MSVEDEGEEDPQGLLQRLRSEFDFVQGNFLVMVMSWLFLDFFTELPGTYYPLYVKALGGTASTIGLIGAVQNVAVALVQIPGGYLTDKYGRRWLIASMTFVAAFARLFYAYAPSWEWIMVGAAISGFCSIYQPALGAIVADSLPKEKRGMGFSIINLITSVSTTPAPLIAGYLFTLYGLVPSMRLIYKLVFVGFIVAAIFRTRLKETVESPAKINVKEMLGEYPVSLRESVNVWRLVPSAAFVLFLISVITSFASGLFQPVLTLYIVQDLGIGEVELSYIMTALPVTMILLALPAGKMVDRVDKRVPIMLSFVLWGAAILLLVYGDFYRLILSMMLVGLLMILVNSATSALSAELVPQEHRGKVNGSRGFFAMIAAALGQLMGGWLYDNVSHQMPFLLELVLIV
ncbi:MAG TPA: MFS transporter, partial [Candidatus Krumholzibacteriaceae bacterium]|nr:MFS transporter [Candidatus Krumholzibacteriaceae bacterium]